MAAALLANLLISIGFVVEKRALTGLPPLSATRPQQLVLHLLRSPLWIVGAASLALGFLAQLAVYRTLPLMAAQGLFVTGLVMLLLLSSVFLGEESSGRERWGMASIVVALVMIVLSLRGDTEEISRSAPTAVMVAIVVPSILAGLALFAGAERRSKRRHRLPTAGVPYGAAVGFLYGVSSLAIKGVAGLLDTADLAGSVTSVLTSPYPYILMVTGSTGLVLSQTALQRCRASLIVPVCTTVTFLYTVAAGTVAFSEPLPEDPLRLALRLGGSVLAVSVLLTMPRHDEPPQHGPERSEAGPDADGGTGPDADGGAPQVPPTYLDGTPVTGPPVGGLYLDGSPVPGGPHDTPAHGTPVPGTPAQISPGRLPPTRAPALPVSPGPVSPEPVSPGRGEEPPGREAAERGEGRPPSGGDSPNGRSVNGTSPVQGASGSPPAAPSAQGPRTARRPEPRPHPSGPTARKVNGTRPAHETHEEGSRHVT
ncbi:hypothetical protein JGS22_002515 [Streptomyces sp. P38-E01]|uniref:Magnesium transporter NIPA n=1 Tax=Streptomyces tardus TaxID=2780544 RepID=A0A949N369_9ACTN|nr:hypothetical protein [Streptomyces tardus]